MSLMDIRRQRGQAIVEHIILWPTLVLLTLGTLQMALLYRDKITFNDATFRAAREGALNHANINVMNKKLVEGLVPLYQKRANGSAYATALTLAYTDNAINPLTGGLVGVVAGVNVEVISPNRSIFNAFKKPMYELESGCEQLIETVSQGNNRTRCRDRGERLFTQIPNDNLHFRSDDTLNVVVSGESIPMNIQDANLLKIRAHWCAPLTIPFGRFALYQWTRTWQWVYENTGGNTHPHWPACRAKTQANALLSAAGSAPRTMFIPVSSDYMIRMQSPVRCQGDEQVGNASRCTNLN
jgi:hypothetical protein